MRYTRNAISTNDPFDLNALKLHVRVDADDDEDELRMLAHAAAYEIEAYCDIALLSQLIFVAFDTWGDVVELPVGPFYAQGAEAHPVTIMTRDEAGNITDHPGAGWMTTGRYPRLHLTEKLEGKTLLVEYPAGFGETVEAIPADLQLAIYEQTARAYDVRGDEDTKHPLAPATARICARHRKVRV